MPEIKKHKKIYRDNISCVNSNFLRVTLNIKKSLHDDFRVRVLHYLDGDISDIVLQYYESKDISVLSNYIELNGVPEEHFAKDPTRRLITERILQDKLPNEKEYRISKDAILYLSRILLYKMRIIAQDFQ